MTAARVSGSCRSRLIAAIDHPNIIPIYDAGEVGETLYIAMRRWPAAI